MLDPRNMSVSKCETKPEYFNNMIPLNMLTTAYTQNVCIKLSGL